MVSSSKKAGLGRTLNRAQKHVNEKRNPRKTDRHTTEVDASANNDKLKHLKSVITQSNLDQFLEEADLAGKQFITERRNVTLMGNDDDQTNLYERDERLPLKLDRKLSRTELENFLNVPRRPKWDEKTTPEQLDELEKLTFLHWRRGMAKLQEQDNITLTPFEKNLEVWRQLWRVIERSDIVVQILDCRNPLLYICDDLIKYVSEFKPAKMSILLLNKADYLTEEQRKMWFRYFRTRKITVIFFSALLENENLKHDVESEPKISNDAPIGCNNHATRNTPELSALVEKISNELMINEDSDEIEDLKYLCRVYDKYELLDKWHDMLDDLERMRQGKQAQESFERPEQFMTVGLVGYPNVGKSSTINALLSAKRVAVSSTPGKTKHFQTFFIDKDMMLCDCPGLVFPSFISNKDEMIINGILPIDQAKDCIGPVRLIVKKIPRAFFEDIYGLAFDYDPNQNITAEDLLNAFGYMRGYMTARGLPDISRAARKVCKDYINGKILYCEAPPGSDYKLYQRQSKLAEIMSALEEKSKDPSQALKMTERQRRLMRQAKGTDINAQEFDAQFFSLKSKGVHMKGLPGIGNMTQPIGQHCEVKVAKREKKHKKREKLRRVFRHLDE